MNKTYKLAIVTLITSCTSGCATLELLAASGVSYLITGKSITDNAVSIVSGQDCALHRIVTETSICESATSAESSTLLTANGVDNSDVQDARISALAQDFVAELDVPVDSIEPQEASNSAAVYAVVGSFFNQQFALERQKLYVDFDAITVMVKTDSGNVYRVIAGPFDDKEFTDELPNFVGKEVNAPWAIELCPDTLDAPPCDSSLLVSL
ncbi:MAG: hypothetical protein GJ680_00705 [Alteromonadaceae bacterium]|nr:hypothetical protein [Alteromonadaceae bacterium]